MPDPIALDATPRSLLCHPNVAVPDVREIRQWLRERLAGGIPVSIAEMADYEVRRALIRVGRATSIERLNRLQATLTSLPIDVERRR